MKLFKSREEKVRDKVNAMQDKGYTIRVGKCITFHFKYDIEVTYDGYSNSYYCNRLTVDEIRMACKEAYKHTKEMKLIEEINVN